jgi:hypothetical protein
MCSPTRSSILEGVYPARSGITTPSCHELRVNLETKLVANPTPQMKAINADSLTRLKSEYFTLAGSLHRRRSARNRSSDFLHADLASSISRA